ncbi:hypothetical protein BDV35DRAFT_342779 [Aspergillus flavus]|uniref:Uncharacterized protein n=1 Tax=Aspergillus flavus TaxID=5059 RepID=A0A5N6H6Y2_ASPFL|nr:hypothetical protein BDV35DRAFT_342779 [Aspergillus flavus]
MAALLCSFHSPLLLKKTNFEKRDFALGLIHLGMFVVVPIELTHFTVPLLVKSVGRVDSTTSSTFSLVYSSLVTHAFFYSALYLMRRSQG